MPIERAPRLKWTTRESFGSRMDPLVKAGLRSIARQEGKSMSWTVEEVIIRYFKLRHCLYVERKKLEKKK